RELPAIRIARAEPRALAFVEQRHRRAAQREFIGGGDADNAGANDDDLFRGLHGGTHLAKRAATAAHFPTPIKAARAWRRESAEMPSRQPPLPRLVLAERNSRRRPMKMQPAPSWPFVPAPRV